MKKLAIILFLVLSVATSYAAEEGDADIQLPGSVKVMKQMDASADLMSRLFGPAWNDIAGTAETAANLGTFNGLIVSILGVLNFAALLYVGASIVYIWSIFVVMSAHQGEKLGGNVYDSLWLPVRHSCAFSLVVPIFNGLSLMQVIILACISLSINFANAIWDTTIRYYSDSADVHINNAVDVLLENESYETALMMFKDAVIQRIDIDMKQNGNQKSESEILAESEAKNFQFNPGATGVAGVMYYRGSTFPANWDGEYDKNGHLVVTVNDEAGVMTVKMRDVAGWTIPVYGKIHISYPERKSANDPESLPEYRLRQEISSIKLKHLANLYQKIYDGPAKAYVTSRASSKDSDTGCAAPKSGAQPCEPAENAEKALKDFIAKDLKEFTSKLSADLKTAVRKGLDGNVLPNLKQMVSKAISGESESSGKGWIMAGLYPFTIASAQDKITQLAKLNTIMDMGNPRHIFPPNVYNDNQKHAMRSAQQYFNKVGGLTSAVYLSSASNTVDGNLLSSLGEAIKIAFVGDDETNISTGISVLGTVLKRMKTENPIIIIQNFGAKVLDGINNNIGTVTVAAIGAALIGGTLFIMALCLLYVLSLFFAYGVPIIPTLFWCIALMSWLFMVVETMVAAPFWVCAHALPEGEGLAGSHARRGYMMLLDVIARPTLLVIGAIFAVAICQISGWLCAKLLTVWFENSSSIFQFGLAADLIYSVIVMSMIYYIFYTVFTRGINYFPQHVIQWCGGSPGGLPNAESNLGAIVTVGGTLAVAGGADKLSEATRKAVAFGKQKTWNNEKMLQIRQGITDALGQYRKDAENAKITRLKDEISETGSPEAAKKLSKLMDNKKKQRSRNQKLQDLRNDSRAVVAGIINKFMGKENEAAITENTSAKEAGSTNNSVEYSGIKEYGKSSWNAQNHGENDPSRYSIKKSESCSAYDDKKNSHSEQIGDTENNAANHNFTDVDIEIEEAGDSRQTPDKTFENSGSSRNVEPVLEQGQMTGMDNPDANVARRESGRDSGSDFVNSISEDLTQSKKRRNFPDQVSSIAEDPTQKRS